MSTVDHLISKLNESSKKVIGGRGLAIPDPVRLPTGIFALDLAVGGGPPEGRVTVIYGTESSMKSTVCLKLIAQYQKTTPEKRCVYIDVEGHLLQSWAETQGVNWAELIVVVPDLAEQVVDLIEGLMMADDIGIIVLDSIAALMTQREMDADAETAQVGTQGLLINKLYRRITHSFNESRRRNLTPTLILINQIRFKIGVMHGDPETMPGGPSVKFVSSLTIRLSGTDEIVKDVNPNLPAYKKVRATIKKHKIPVISKASEFVVALLPIPDIGLKVGESYDWNTVLQYLRKLELLTKSDGGWELSKTVTGVAVTYPKQDDLKARYFESDELRRKIQKIIIETLMKRGDMIEPE